MNNNIKTITANILAYLVPVSPFHMFFWDLKTGLFIIDVGGSICVCPHTSWETTAGFWVPWRQKPICSGGCEGWASMFGHWIRNWLHRKSWFRNKRLMEFCPAVVENSSRCLRYSIDIYYTYLSIYLFIYLSIYLIYLSIYLYIYQYAYVCIQKCVCT